MKLFNRLLKHMRKIEKHIKKHRRIHGLRLLLGSIIALGSLALFITKTFADTPITGTVLVMDPNLNPISGAQISIWSGSDLLLDTGSTYPPFPSFSALDGTDLTVSATYHGMIISGTIIGVQTGVYYSFDQSGTLTTGDTFTDQFEVDFIGFPSITGSVAVRDLNSNFISGAQVSVEYSGGGLLFSGTSPDGPPLPIFSTVSGTDLNVSATYHGMTISGTIPSVHSSGTLNGTVYYIDQAGIVYTSDDDPMATFGEFMIEFDGFPTVTGTVMATDQNGPISGAQISVEYSGGELIFSGASTESLPLPSFSATSGADLYVSSNAHGIIISGTIIAPQTGVQYMIDETGMVSTGPARWPGDNFEINFVYTSLTGQVLVTDQTGNIISGAQVSVAYVINGEQILSTGSLPPPSFYAISGADLYVSGTYNNITITGIILAPQTGVQYIFYDSGTVGTDFTRFGNDHFEVNFVYTITGGAGPSSCIGNNDNFLDQAFWNATPTTGQIICALYGSGGSDQTAYTQNWILYNSSSCIDAGMNVEYINDYTTSGADTIPEYLSQNTVYVLLSGSHVTSRPINLSGCSAIVGNGDVTLYSSTGLDIQPTLSASRNANTIIDNIAIDGFNDGLGGDHTQNADGVFYSFSSNNTINNMQTYDNTNGIYYMDGSSNNTINNAQSYNNINDGIIYSSSSNNNTMNNSLSYNNGGYGIFYLYSNYDTIDNVQAYDNNYGIYYNSSSYNIINNVQAYNNNNAGILYNFSSINNTIDNTQAYNNINDGIDYDNSSSNNTINNTQSYNNAGAGIFSNSSSNNTTNNSQFYNNNYGIYYNSSSNNTINNTKSYNNNAIGLYTNLSTNSKYYGNLSLFNNSGGNFFGTSGNDSSLTGGTGTYFASLGWTSGSLITGTTMSRNYLANPLNGSGIYMLDRSLGFPDLMGVKIWSGDALSTSYSYGGDISLQQEGVLWNGVTLITGGTYNPSQFIGSSINYLSGSIDISGYYNNSSGVSLTFTSAVDTNWRLFGDIAEEQSGTIAAGGSITTGATLSGSEGYKTVFLQLWTGTDFATHYADTTYYHQHSATISGNLTYTNTTGITLLLTSLPEYDYLVTGDIDQSYIGTLSGTSALNIFLTPGDGTKNFTVTFSSGGFVFTSALSIIIDTFVCTGDNDNFINQAFWDASPGPAKIICALYGSGGTDQTAYTQNRSGYNSGSCINNGMNVAYINTGTDILPEYLSQNTVYVLLSGSHITSSGINLSGCSAIVGNGDVTLYSNTLIPNMLGALQNENTIIDNIAIDGTGDGAGGEHTTNTLGIIYNYSSNNTINNVQTYNNGSIGINYNYFSNNNIINNTQSYNNANAGIKYYSYSNNNTINNSQVHNGTFGIYYDASSNNNINNSQAYNNTEGIFYSYSPNNTTNNSQAYNNNFGIYYDYSSYNTINNAKAYNNSYGLYYSNSSNNKINNSESYKNSSDGISFAISSNNIINNSQSYKNGNVGIECNGTSNYNIINNSQAYNNGYGIRFDYSSNNTINNSQSYNNNIYGIMFQGTPNNIINNSQSYNNGNYGITIDGSSAGNKYYGNLNIFSNSGGNLLGTSGNDANLTGGTGTYFASLGRTSGTLTTGISMSRLSITNPLNGSGIYMLNRGTGFINLRTPPARSGGILPISYSYGGNILLQRQGVRWSGAALVASGTYNSGQFIGSSVNRLTGGIDIPGATTTTSGISLTLTSAIAANWRLFGNIVTEKSGTISAGGSITTGVILSGGTGSKNVFLQLWTGTDFATHYIDSITLITPVPFSGVCLSGWNNDNFIDQTFWNQNPGTGGVICALYGSGGLDQTAYTQNWNGYNSGTCLNNGMAVVYVPEGTNTLPPILTSNTIYVLTGQTYISPNTIYLNTCSTIISNTGNSIFYSTGYLSASMFYDNAQQATIIDNIAIDGRGDGLGGTHTNNNYGIYYFVSSNNTINNIQAYNNDYGIQYYSSSNNSINNAQAYNNNYGIDYSESSKNTINNSQSYNNTYGIIYSSSGENTMNNTQAYNNQGFGIAYSSSSNNTMNNSLSYNNGDIGIYYFIGSNNNIMNNSLSYNNGSAGIYTNLSTGNIYYGNLSLFNNSGGNLGGTLGNDTSLTGGTSEFTYLGWTAGTLITSSSMSWNYLTNPLNGSGIYMLDRSLGFTNLVSNKTWSGNILPISHSYGGNISLQQQGVRWSGGLITGGAYNPSQFIGSSINRLSGSIAISGTTTTSGISLTFTSAVATNWRLFGDITAEKSGTIASGGSITTGVILSGSEGLKNVLLQLWTGTDFATHYSASTNYHRHSAIISGNLTSTYTTGITLLLASFPEYNYLVTGDMIQSYTGTLNGEMALNIFLTEGDGVKTGTVTFSSGSFVFTSTFSIILKPSIPSYFSGYINNSNGSWLNVEFNRFDFGDARKSIITLGNTYDLIINIKNTLGRNTNATDTVPTPGGFRYHFPLNSNQTGNFQLKVKYFNTQ